MFTTKQDCPSGLSWTSFLCIHMYWTLDYFFSTHARCIYMLHTYNIELQKACRSSMISAEFWSWPNMLVLIQGGNSKQNSCSSTPICWNVLTYIQQSIRQNSECLFYLGPLLIETLFFPFCPSYCFLIVGLPRLIISSHLARLFTCSRSVGKKRRIDIFEGADRSRYWYSHSKGVDLS